MTQRITKIELCPDAPDSSESTWHYHLVSQRDYHQEHVRGSFPGLTEALAAVQEQLQNETEGEEEAPKSNSEPSPNLNAPTTKLWPLKPITAFPEPEQLLTLAEQREAMERLHEAAHGLVRTGLMDFIRTVERREQAKCLTPRARERALELLGELNAFERMRGTRLKRDVEIFLAGLDHPAETEKAE